MRRATSATAASDQRQNLNYAKGHIFYSLSEPYCSHPHSHSLLLSLSPHAFVDNDNDNDDEDDDNCCAVAFSQLSRFFAWLLVINQDKTQVIRTVSTLCSFSTPRKSGFLSLPLLCNTPAKSKERQAQTANDPPVPSHSTSPLEHKSTKKRTS